MEEVLTIKQYVCTPEEIKKINCADFYSTAKEIIKSCEDYKDYETGCAILIKRIGKDSNNSYVNTDYRSNVPQKYIIIHNDNGFIFAKKIISTGFFFIVSIASKPLTAVTTL